MGSYSSVVWAVLERCLGHVQDETGEQPKGKKLAYSKWHGPQFPLQQIAR